MWLEKQHIHSLKTDAVLPGTGSRREITSADGGSDLAQRGHSGIRKSLEHKHQTAPWLCKKKLLLTPNATSTAMARDEEG